MPPLPVSVSVCPYTTVVVVNVSAVDCVAFAIVTVAFDVVIAAYWSSAAFVAVTTHEVALVGVSVAFPVPPKVQSPDTFAKVTAPSPDPPEVANVVVAP